MKSAEANIKLLISTPTTAAAKAQIDEIKKRTEVYEKKVEVLRNCTEVISADEKKILLEGHDKLLREYR